MKKRGIFMGIIVIAVIVFIFIGYNIYRHPSTFRHLTDRSLDEKQTEKIRQQVMGKNEKNILVAYFSYSGTTKNVAENIRQKIGGELFEITPKKEYSNVYTQSNSEIRWNKRPELLKEIGNMEQYDIVFVGYPVWWHATPAVINSFLESYDLKGKLIIPFCTSGGSDIDETMPTFLNSCEGLAVYGGQRINSSSDVDSWLKNLGLTEVVTRD